MQVSIDFDACLGYANCVLDAPQVFQIVANGVQVRIVQESPPEELRKAVEAAALDCPARAITVAD